MKWFKHDTDASNDAKIKRLLLRHGAEGYAIYFHCIELIAGDVSENNITFELEHDSEIIADNLKIKGEQSLSAIDKVNMIMRTIVDLGLFEESGNRIFCAKLSKRINKSMTSNEGMRKIIGNIKNHDLVMTQSCKNRTEQNRTEQKRIEQKEQNRFKKPTLQEVKDYIKEKDYKIDPVYYIDKMESIGWMSGKNKIVDWKRSINTWEKNRKKWEDKPIEKGSVMDYRPSGAY